VDRTGRFLAACRRDVVKSSKKDDIELRIDISTRETGRKRGTKKQFRRDQLSMKPNEWRNGNNKGTRE
jgi:hypothetical protein